MPLHARLERLIGMAIVDGEFRAALLSSPAFAAADFGLTSEEMELLTSARRGTLEELAAHIYSRLPSLPRPAHAPQARWAIDGHYGIRAAV